MISITAKTLTAAALAAVLAGCGAATQHGLVSGDGPARPASTQTATPDAQRPTVQPVNKVTFIVTGTAPAQYGQGLSIMWGSSSDSRQYTFSGDFAGTWKRSLPFDPSASYYDVTAQLSGSGEVSVKIIVTGPPPDVPLVVSKGHAQGGYAVASAQAAPVNTAGTSWMNEN